MYSYAPYYSFLRVLGCTCFVFYPFVECSKSSFHSIICVFLRYGEGKKRYCCIDPVSHKLYVSCHVFILEHIPFFYILVMFHNVSNNSKLVHIDPLLDDIDSFPTNTSTLVPNHHTSFSPSMATSTLSETMNHFSPHSSQHLSKFTQLPNFIYSSYLDSFTSFLAFIHNFFWSLSYKEVILDPFW